MVFWGEISLLRRRAISYYQTALLGQERGQALLLGVLPRRLSGYKNLDVLSAYATVENIKEDDFREEPASFENKVRDIVAPVYRDQ